MKLLFAIIIATVTLTGCSSTTKSTKANKAAAIEKVAKTKDLKCRKENPTGSRLGRYKCTTKEQRESRHQTAQRVMQNQAQSTTGRAVNNGG